MKCKSIAILVACLLLFSACSAPGAGPAQTPSPSSPPAVATATPTVPAPSATTPASISTELPTGAYKLIVSDVVFSNMLSLGEILFEDESGKGVKMPLSWDEWFGNWTVASVKMAEGSTIHMQLIGNKYNYSLSPGSSLTFNCTVAGKEYAINLAAGTVFIAKKTSGGYDILPDETMALQKATVAQPQSSPTTTP